MIPYKVGKLHKNLFGRNLWKIPRGRKLDLLPAGIICYIDNDEVVMVLEELPPCHNWRVVLVLYKDKVGFMDDPTLEEIQC